MKQNKVIYTCITGDYDDLIGHKYINPKFDYVCFTDNKKLLNSDIYPWKILPLRFARLNDIKNARWHKTHPHKLFPEYCESIWVDGNIDILSDSLFKRFEKSKFGIMIPEHFRRDCIYDECTEVELCKMDTVRHINKIRRFLFKMGMPKNYGLLETNIIFRKHHNDLIKKINNIWWKMIKKYSHRDQLSFTYVLWKNGIIIDNITMPNNRFTKIEYMAKEHIIEKKPQVDFFRKEKTANGRIHIFISNKKIFSWKRK